MMVIGELVINTVEKIETKLINVTVVASNILNSLNCDTVFLTAISKV